MDTMIKDTQVNFKTNAELLKKAKEVFEMNNLDLTSSFNLFLENVVERNDLPIMTEEELKRERLFKSLQAEIQKGIDDIEAGRVLSEREMRERFGLS